MISFTEFLLESIEFEQHPHISWWDHYHKIGNDKVRVWFDKAQDKNVYATGFTVNGSDDKEFGASNPVILQHVRKVIHAFVKKHNPDAIKFRALDRNKETMANKGKVYRAFGEQFAKSLGGRYTPPAPEKHIYSHTIHFKK